MQVKLFVSQSRIQSPSESLVYDDSKFEYGVVVNGHPRSRPLVPMRPEICMDRDGVQYLKLWWINRGIKYIINKCFSGCGIMSGGGGARLLMRLIITTFEFGISEIDV